MVNYEYVLEGEERTELEKGIGLLEKSVSIITWEGVTISVNRVSSRPGIPGEISLEPLGRKVEAVSLRDDASAKIYQVTPYGVFISEGRQKYFIRFSHNNSHIK